MYNKVFDEVVSDYSKNLSEPTLTYCNKYVKLLSQKTIQLIGVLPKDSTSKNESRAKHFSNITGIKLNNDEEISIAACIQYICNKMSS